MVWLMSCEERPLLSRFARFAAAMAVQMTLSKCQVIEREEAALWDQQMAAAEQGAAEARRRYRRLQEVRCTSLAKRVCSRVSLTGINP